MRYFYFLSIIVILSSCSSSLDHRMANLIVQGDTVFTDNRCIVVSPYIGLNPHEPDAEAILVASKNYLRRMEEFFKPDSLRIIMTTATVVVFQNGKSSVDPLIYNLKEMNQPVIHISGIDEVTTFGTWFGPLLPTSIKEKAMVKVGDFDWLNIEEVEEKIKEEIPQDKLERMREAEKAERDEALKNGVESRQPQQRESLEKK